MKIEIEPEVALAVLKHLDKRSQKESERLESILAAVTPAIFQFIAGAQGRPFHSERHDSDETAH